jgi:hypothetical protein
MDLKADVIHRDFVTIALDQVLCLDQDGVVLGGHHGEFLYMFCLA